MRITILLDVEPGYPFAHSTNYFVNDGADFGCNLLHRKAFAEQDYTFEALSDNHTFWLNVQ